jgi:hypothetical protein
MKVTGASIGDGLVLGTGGWDSRLSNEAVLLLGYSRCSVLGQLPVKVCCSGRCGAIVVPTLNG